MITFPGHGAPGKHCGETLYHGCWNCRDYFETISKCMKKECPDCYEDWAYRQGLHAAERMTEFLNSPRYLRVIQDAERERFEAVQVRLDASVGEMRFYRIEVYHVVVTFKSRRLSNRGDIAEARQDARDVVRSHGLFGECSIPHRRDDDDEGVHFHFLALGGYISPGRDDGTSYIFKVIQFEGSWFTRGEVDRRRVVQYACTHAIITTEEERSHCVTWSGCVANNKFPGLAEVDHVPADRPMCPHCGGVDTFLVVEKDWLWSHQDVETWTSPDRPPPMEAQRALREFA